MSQTHSVRPARRTPGQLVAAVVGVVFLLVAVLGFVPGVTTDYDQLGLFGHNSDAQLLGLFNVSVLHNIVHGLFGLAGVAMAARPRAATQFLIGGGIIYLVLWVFGLFVVYGGNANNAVNFVPLNDADNWLHLGLAIVMIALGALLRRRRVTPAA